MSELFGTRIDLESPVEPLLACGAEGKNRFCIVSRGKARVSGDMGDLRVFDNYSAYTAAVTDALESIGNDPVIVAHDLHPDMAPTRFGLELASQAGSRTIAVQHHHAHIAACIAEHHIEGKVIGVALDGMGYGDDGTLWGGEFLVADALAYTREYHFKQYRLPGGDEGTLRPERMAISCLVGELGPGDKTIERAIPWVDPVARKATERMASTGLNSPLTSSAGRLFDAVSAMLGFRGRISFPAEAAIKLESLADPSVDDSYPFRMSGKELDFGPVLLQIAGDVRAGIPRETISAMFHNSIVRGVVAACEKVRESAGLSCAVLSGGVFLNRILFSGIPEALKEAGFEVYTNSVLPVSDACVGLGQAVVASEIAKTEESAVKEN